MTMDHEPGSHTKFVPAVLPWLIAAASLIGYLLTLNHWLSINSLSAVARACGWIWQGELFSPLCWLVTAPIRLLPARDVPLALNLFSAVCAALTLALLARTVALLPHDRTHEQRERLKGSTEFLSVPSAWLPPVFAVVVCGLQLSFWENATSASGMPPYLPSNEMFDLLIFAYVIRCLLEF